MKLSALAIAELINSHQGLVRSIALKVVDTLPNQFDLDDLIGYGQVGLAEAAHEYDPARGTRFATYAYYRIRGAIYDGFSDMSWQSRAEYRKQRLQQLANEAVSGQVDEGAGIEVEEKASTTMSAASFLSKTVGRLVVVHLAQEAGEGGVSADTMEDDTEQSPSDELVAEEVRSLLHNAIIELPKEEGELIQRVYFEGLSLTEGARLVGKSKSWASRLHDKALDRLCHLLKQVGVEELSA